MEMDEVFKNLPLAEQKKMLDHLAKLPDVRFLSSEERKNTMKVLRPPMITTPAFMVLILKARKRELLKVEQKVEQKVNYLKV